MMHTAQETFDEVVRYAFTMTHYAAEPPQGNRYRTLEGNKCFVGHLINVEYYTSDLEGLPGHYYMVSQAVKESGWDPRAACALQDIHDKSSVYEEVPLSIMHGIVDKKFADIAQEQGWQYTRRFEV